MQELRLTARVLQVLRRTGWAPQVQGMPRGTPVKEYESGAWYWSTSENGGPAFLFSGGGHQDGRYLVMAFLKLLR